MATVSTDRRQGVNAGSAIKVPCRAATTGPITLSGLQSVDGVSLAQGDRVLVKNQASSVANGIYEASTSTWNRTLDFDGSFDAVSGTLVLITSGSTNASKWFVVTSADPLTIGTSAITFAETQLASSPFAALAADNGSTLIGYIQTGAGADARTVQARLRDVVSVKDFGAVGDGTNDDTAAIQAAIASVSAGGTVYFPRGSYKTTSTITVSDNLVHLLGDGSRASIIKFAPTANDTCLEFSAGASMLNSCGIRGMGFYSADATYTKVALDIIDVSAFVADEIYVSGSTVIGSTQFWGGPSSIALRTKGRECSSFSNMLLAAPIPIKIADNPNSTIDIDHFHFYNLLLFADSNPCVTIDSGVNLTQVTFDGYQAWVLGTHGLYWVDTTSPFTSNGLTLANVRVEQGSSASAYIVQIEHNVALQNVLIIGGQGGADRNGFKFRKCDNVTIEHFYYTGAAGKTALDANSTVNSLRIKNCFWQADGSASLSGQRLIWRTVLYPSAAPVPRDAIYESTSVASRGVTFNDALSQEPISLANNATTTLASDEAMFGFLVVTSNEGVCGTFQVMGPNKSVTEISDPQSAFSITAGTTGVTNIYWSTGSSAYTLQNNRGSSMTYKIFLVGSYAYF